MNWIKQLVRNHIVRYIIAGSLSYLIELSCLLALYEFGHFSVVQATAIAFWIGLAVSFFLQKLLAFKDYQKEVRVITKQLGIYAALVAFNYLFTLVVVDTLPHQAIVFSRSLALIITTAWNYIIYKVIFKPAKATKITMDLDQRFKRFVKKHYSRLVLASILVSIILLASVSAYSSFQGSRVLNFTSDSFVSTFMSADWRPGNTVNLVSQHTNIMKYPILALQGWAHYNLLNYYLVNFALMLLTVFGWSWLLYRIIGRSKRVFVASNLMLGGILLSSTSLVISLVSTTTRNIEYPIALIYLLLLSRLAQRPSRKIWTIAFVIMLLLVSSDYLFLYTLAPAGILFVAWLFWNRRIDRTQLIRVGSNVVLGTLAGIALLDILVKVRVLTLDGRHAGSFILFNALPGDVFNAIGQTFRLMGGYFLGSPAKLSFSGMILSFVFVIIGYSAAYHLTKRHLRARAKEYPAISFLTVMFTAWAFTLYAFYVLLGQASIYAGDNSRYLSLLPFLFVFFIIAQSQHWRRNYSIWLVCGLILLGGLMNSYHNWFSYKDAIVYANQQVNIDKKIIAYDKQHGIKLVLGSYDYGPALRFYAQGSVQSYAILTCNNTFYFFSYENWYKPQPDTVKRSALIVDGYYKQAGIENPYNSANACAQDKIITIYGQPAQKIKIAEHGGQPVYLYVFNYDIRSRLSHARILYL